LLEYVLYHSSIINVPPAQFPVLCARPLQSLIQPLLPASSALRLPTTIPAFFSTLLNRIYLGWGFGKAVPVVGCFLSLFCSPVRSAWIIYHRFPSLSSLFRVISFCVSDLVEIAYPCLFCPGYLSR
jgi:hypothetical protein